MNDLYLSTHAQQMLQERRILEGWVWRTVDFPDSIELGDDDNMHYMKAIPERNGRVLRVVINETTEPNRIVTLFFDRRLTNTTRQK